MNGKNNLELYNRIRSVPKEAQSQVSYGAMKLTAINPMYRLKVLTEEFGPCGEGFRFEILKDDIVEVKDANGTVTESCEYMTVALYYRLENGEWSDPVVGFGGNKIISTNNNGKRVIDEDAKKKCYSDAIGICCKNLGLGADIWWSNDPGDKYGAEYKQVPQKDVAETKPQQPAASRTVTKKTETEKKEVEVSADNSAKQVKPKTIQEAYNTKCPIDTADYDKTIREMMASNKDKIRWYAAQKAYRREYPDFIACCDMVLKATQLQA